MGLRICFLVILLVQLSCDSTVRGQVARGQPREPGSASAPLAQVQLELEECHAGRENLREELDAVTAAYNVCSEDLDEAQRARDQGPSVPGLGELEERPDEPDDPNPDLEISPPEAIEVPRGDIKAHLLALPGVEVEERSKPGAKTRVFVLKLQQPVDHDDPDSPRFTQRIVLRHRSYSAPMVLETGGYGFGSLREWTQRVGDVARIVEGNQLFYEYRYYDQSAPAPSGRDGSIDWSHLNSYQAAADAHAIKTLFSPIYQGKWLATGVSKGGLSALFHHFHFRDDLDGVVTYVTPMIFGVGDRRFETALENIGPKDGLCRQRVREAVVEAVQRRDELAAVMRNNDYYQGFGALDREVQEAHIAYAAQYAEWFFWQKASSVFSCSFLPETGGFAEEFVSLVFFDTKDFSDDNITDEPFVYQTLTELGEPLIVNPPALQAELDPIDLEILPRNQGPDWSDIGVHIEFDSSIMKDLDAFLKKDAKRVVAFYGAWDPWTAGKITLAPDADNEVFVISESNHSTSLFLMSDERKRRAIATIRRFAGLPESDFEF